MELVPTATCSALIELAALGGSDWETVIQHVLRLDSSLLNVERVSFWSFHEDPPYIFCELGYVAGTRSFERGMRLFEDQARRYFQELRCARIIAAADARTDERTHELGSYLDALGIASMLDVPVWAERRLAGVLCHEHVGAPRRWTPANVEFVAGLVQSVSAALEARGRRQAEEGARRAAFLAQVSWALSGTLQPEQIAERAARSALPMLGELAVVTLTDEPVPHIAAIAHVRAEHQARLRALAERDASSIVGWDLVKRVARGGQSLLVPAIRDDGIDACYTSPEQAETLRTMGARSAMAVPLRTGGRVTGVVTFMASTQTYDQGMLRLAEDYAERAASALANARAYRAAEDAVRARDEFLHLAAHELRTPLTALLACAEVLERHACDDPAQMARRIEPVVRQTKKLIRMVDRVLDAFALRTGQAEMRRERVDLAELAKTVARELSTALAQAGCTLAIRADAPVLGDWDRSRLALVLTSLLENAMTFGRGKPIALSVEMRDHVAVVSIRDQGIGFTEEDARQLFRPFARGVPASRYGGLGLGLYVARSVAEAHGGTLRAEANPSGGATFTLELPHALAQSGGARVA